MSYVKDGKVLMSYQNPDIESSYREHDLGKTLYDFVLQKKPKIIIEFGTLYGYSAVAMAMALKEIGAGKIKCYDLWDKYPYKHSTLDQTKRNICQYGLENYIQLAEANFETWEPESFDLLHLDISNDGNTILSAQQKLSKQLNMGSVLVFEGGSVERDRIHWMQAYQKRPINSLKPALDFTVLNTSFPSISVLN